MIALHTQIDSIASVVSPTDVKAVAIEAPAPEPAVATATNSDPVSSPIPPAPVHSAPLSNVEAASLFSSVDPGPAGVDLEAAVCALEADWLAQGVSLADPLGIPPFLKRGADNVAPFIKNSTTFRVVQESLTEASVPSSDISNPSPFSVGA